jgi:hypothetical protein
MLTKAGDALEAVIQQWNNERSWNFLRTTHTFITVPPFTVADCDTQSGSVTVTAPSFFDVAEGDVVSGSGIAPETYVIAVSLTAVPDQITLSQPVGATANNIVLTFARRDYEAPTNYKYIYSMRNTTTGHTVSPIDSRIVDNASPSQIMVDDPYMYDPHPVGAAGKFRFYPTPNGVYGIEAKIYRRMAVPDDDADVLDIPIDFEWGILSGAKALFLTDKVGYDRASAFWAAQGEKELKNAKKSDSLHPDAQQGFLPGYLQPSVSGVGVTVGGDTVAGTDGAGGWGVDFGSDWGD